MNPSSHIAIYSEDELPFTTLDIEKAASGFQFTEGPVWHPEGYLLFSDIPANRIWQLFPDGGATIYLEKSGCPGEDIADLSDMIGSNGLAIDRHENLVFCQHGNHAIAWMNQQKTVSVVTGSYKDRLFNSPNDIALRSDGIIYFTDPPYGLKDQVLHPNKFQPVSGVYRYLNRETRLLSTDLHYPNGICFSPDERYLYVSSNHPDEPHLWRYQVSAGGDLSHPSILTEQNADGIKTDLKGNLYLCTDEGVLIVSPEGKRIALIRLPETPANLAWIVPGRQGMYVTARSSIYLVSGFH